MNQKILHTPEGVRDIYNAECEKKLFLQDSLYKVLKLYGFHDIQTPMFEFADIYKKERGTMDEREMYRFIDREGNTLVLRPDITPSIARCVAKYYKEEELPIRLCYVGNTFVNGNSYQGKLKESTQLGAELILDDTVDADAEMIALTIDCLLKSGLKEFQVEIGQADFFKGLVEEANFNEEEAEQIRVLIESKNLFGVEEIVSSKEIDKNLKDILLKLPELFGSLDKLVYVKNMTKSERARKAIERLEKLYEILTEYGFEKYITFDLGMLSKYNYYTGIIFRAYTYGTGEAIVNGGRYDNLLKQFGKDAPAIGLAIVIDQLMIALSRQKINIIIEEQNTLILYDSTANSTAIRNNAILLVNSLRSKGANTELLRKTGNKNLQDYEAYAKQNHICSIYYLEEEDFVQNIDVETNNVNKIKISELVNQIGA
ncbi:ATP phosphoribosyltransferase regulatory subunit [Anaeromicropila herbilytica]|uniref:ATP phosphoribosyltransferase regulatory subunit n=1 Tax=Anaeromicropila herbilytica TaxID=2785025 RepID=A0A7R7EKQ1_9FIRM|nr:ATP phosphoribosyltransferase regulatory subunit [Anaeromicropila herbilytica]BCN30549.1 ATP phosphoribosyltransferase regulatory subunit [Anaeromicropila herbilytica]